LIYFEKFVGILWSNDYNEKFWGKFYKLGKNNAWTKPVKSNFEEAMGIDISK